jgi:hypothetical protein
MLGGRAEKAAVQRTALSVQMTEVIKDIAELKADSRARWDHHEAQHTTEAQTRLVGRRWLIAIGVACLGSMAAVLGLLIQILGHVH